MENNLYGREKAILGLTQSIESASEKDQHKTEGRQRKLNDMRARKEVLLRDIESLKQTSYYVNVQLAKSNRDKFWQEIGLIQAEKELNDFMVALQSRVDSNIGPIFENVRLISYSPLSHTFPKL